MTQGKVEGVAEEVVEGEVEVEVEVGEDKKMIDVNDKKLIKFIESLLIPSLI